MINCPNMPNRLLGRCAVFVHRAVIGLFCIVRGLASFASEPGILQLEPLAGSRERPVVTALSLNPTDGFLAAAGDDHAIRLVRLVDRQIIQVWESHLDWVRGVRFSPSGRLIASCANDGWIHVFEVDSRDKIASVRAEHALHDLTFVDENTLYALGFHSAVYRWKIRSPELQVDHQSDCQDLRTIDYCSKTNRLAYGGRDGVLRVRDVTEVGSRSYVLMPAHFDRIRSMRFSDEGRFVVSVGEDRRLIRFDIETKSIVGTMEIKGGKLVGLCPMSNNLFAVAGSDNTINIIAWNNPTPKLRLIGHDGTVTLLYQNSNLLVSSSFDTTIRIWDLEKAADQQDEQGRYIHPVAAQFEDSGALSKQGVLVRKPIP